MVFLKEEPLNLRFKGSSYFSHRIKIVGSRTEASNKFIEIRNWCWETWNPSMERDVYLSLVYNSPNPVSHLPKHWTWHTNFDDNEYFIYLKSLQDLAFFKLKWM